MTYRPFEVTPADVDVNSPFHNCFEQLIQQEVIHPALLYSQILETFVDA